MLKISSVKAIQVFDSRGLPTVSCKIILENGISALAIVPSGASTGSKEALELRDNDSEYHGKGVLSAVYNVNEQLSQLIIGKDPNDQKSIDELFSASIFENSIMKQSTISESIIAINQGDWNFTVKKLPSRVQLSCVCGIVCSDINNDGNLDLIMAGNNFEFKPQYSRLDANYGSVLLGDGNLGFTWQDYNTSGFVVKNEVKHLKKIKDNKGKTYLIVAINNESPKLFLINE